MTDGSGGIMQTHPESPFSTSGGKFGTSWVLGLRVFLDGVYHDPPAEVLPPIPAMQPADDCCNIL